MFSNANERRVPKEIIQSFIYKNEGFENRYLKISIEAFTQINLTDSMADWAFDLATFKLIIDDESGNLAEIFALRS